MSFNEESKFEQEVIKTLQRYGWEDKVIEYPNEADLLKNWANILFENNRQIDRLNNQPLTDSEMAQIIEQINTLKTPLMLNGLINGKTIAITRDNPNDPLHLGKEVSLKIYDRREIAAGSSRYQIVKQPKFTVSNAILPPRRGDLMLLINGMPVFHIELKRTGVPISEATNQIEKYLKNGVFTDLFALVQIFVAMKPEETLYFSNNTDANGKLNRSYFFQWADFNNEPIKDWKLVIEHLLSIPMAHQLIGFYTIADEGDGCLKVMRSYQYYAASRIANIVSKVDWTKHNQRGGYIWHTTGSGKTMSSFKSAQLIATSGDADKVIFLVDRIELGTQSIKEYQNFADNKDEVQDTSNTHVLMSKLKSNESKDTLIVTSIQKMSNIKAEPGVNEKDIEQIGAKRLVFIVDECHRTTFGDMMIDIKQAFPDALFFGFTGTPILEENQRKNNTSADIFGDELHRYSLADGIRDANVLGFDPYRVSTYKESDLRKVVGLHEAKAKTVEEAMNDEAKKQVYLKFQDSKQVPMVGSYQPDGTYNKGIEDYLPPAQYRSEEHQNAVVDDILEKWDTLSQAGMFHALFATSSIPEAIEYYRLLKQKNPKLKITALFDPNEGNSEGYEVKQDGIVEILTDYNARYGQNFTMSTYASFKKDVANRLAHKEQYKYISYKKDADKQLDLLIVVDQMLTGFDSKWLNTLYLDKLMRYESIIQAFSRTNRLFGPEKPFGTIRYYRYPFRMQRNVESAVKLYSGDKPFGLFVEKLADNIRKINFYTIEIKGLFLSENITNYDRLPKNPAIVAKFAQQFSLLNEVIEAARIQGFKWDVQVYHFVENDEKQAITVELDEQTYLTWLLRYKELAKGGGGSGGSGEIPFEIDSHITEIDTGRIDSDYMNSEFEKYLKLLHSHGDANEIERVLVELHKTFASLTQEEQRCASIFLQDVQSGEAELQEGKTLRDYITDYQVNAKNSKIDSFANNFGLDKDLLIDFLNQSINEKNINEFSRFNRLKQSADKSRIQSYFEEKEGKTIALAMANIKFAKLLKEFLLQNAKI